MANGYCEALLLHLDSIAGQNYPGQKVTIPGFLNMLVTAPDRPSTIQDGYREGHYRTVNVKYMPRTTVSQVSTTDTCAVDVIPAYKETTVSVGNIAQVGVWIPDDTIRQYCEEASRTVAIGQPATQIMTEHLRGILNAMNGIYQKMENVLTTSMASSFGKHKGTGSATAVTVNIEQDGNLNDLGTGLTKLLTDFQANEGCGTPQFVGALGSLMHAYSIQKQRNALGMGTGIDFGAMANDFNFYASGQTGSTWGAQHVGMFSPGSVHLVERFDNVGSFAGQRGSSFFTSIVDPRTQCWTPNGLGNIQFDLQVKYVDCPEDLGANITNGYINAESVSSARGYLLLIKKRYGLFTTPTDAYDGADVLAGSNGSLRYAITNS
jgi:hypothetical protein